MTNERKCDGTKCSHFLTAMMDIYKGQEEQKVVFTDCQLDTCRRPLDFGFIDFIITFTEVCHSKKIHKQPLIYVFLYTLQRNILSFESLCPRTSQFFADVHNLQHNTDVNRFFFILCHIKKIAGITLFLI